MASPALLSAQDTLDPQRKAQYTIHIPQDLLDGSPKDSSYASVRYNHKPGNALGTRRTIKFRSPSTSHNQSIGLDIKDRKDGGNSSTYHYEGTKSSPKQSYVLVFNQQNQTATLQPITSSYSFNLKSSPGESSPTLVDQYPQLHEGNDSIEDVAQDNLASSMFDDEPDPDNPFDFRHFLDGAKSPRLSPSPAPSATGLTPNPSSHYLGSSPARERAASNPEGRTSASKHSERPTPRIRVQRKATDDRSSSTSSSSRPLSRQKIKAISSRQKPTSSPSIPGDLKHSNDSQEFDLVAQQDTNIAGTHTPDIQIEIDDDDDDFMGISGPGGLEIDFGDEGPPPSRARAITLPGSSASSAAAMAARNGLGITGALGGRRPISLRSAANSPGSQVQTPRKRLQDIADEDDADVLELGGSGSRLARSTSLMGQSLADEDEDADVSSDEDEEPLAMSKKRTDATTAAAKRSARGSDGDDGGVEDGDIEPMQLDLSAGQGEDDDGQGMDVDAAGNAEVGQEDEEAWDDLSTGGYVQRVQESESESEAE